MLYAVYIFSTRFFYGRNWWCSMSIITFITPLKMILKSQVVDKKPINNPIQGRCY